MRTAVLPSEGEKNDGGSGERRTGEVIAGGDEDLTIIPPLCEETTHDPDRETKISNKVDESGE